MERLNPEFSICNQNVEPSTAYPIMAYKLYKFDMLAKLYKFDKFLLP